MTATRDRPRRSGVRTVLLVWMVAVVLTQWLLHGPGKKWVDRHTGLPIERVGERLRAFFSPPLGS